MPCGSVFLAGKCFVRYQRAGGTRHTLLPDFYIGAHAAVSGMTLLTRRPPALPSVLPEAQADRSLARVPATEV